MKKITAKKIKAEDLTNTEQAEGFDSYDVFIEEERVDEAGNAYTYVRKEMTNLKKINAEIDNINIQIDALKAIRDELQDKKSQLK